MQNRPLCLVAENKAGGQNGAAHHAGHELAEVHRPRYRVFKQRLDCSVKVSGDMEVDEVNVLRPVHLLNRAASERIQGCVRLLPSTDPTMLRDTFPIQLDGNLTPRNAQIWRAADLRSI